MIRKHIVKYLETNNLLNQGQHGFRSGRSCLTQLIDHYDRVLHQCETGANVDVIYLDFAKLTNIRKAVCSTGYLEISDFCDPSFRYLTIGQYQKDGYLQISDFLQSKSHI